MLRKFFVIDTHCCDDDDDDDHHHHCSPQPRQQPRQQPLLRTTHESSPDSFVYCPRTVNLMRLAFSCSRGDFSPQEHILRSVSFEHILKSSFVLEGSASSQSCPRQRATFVEQFWNVWIREEGRAKSADFVAEAREETAHMVTVPVFWTASRPLLMLTLSLLFLE